MRNGWMFSQNRRKKTTYVTAFYKHCGGSINDLACVQLKNKL